MSYILEPLSKDAILELFDEKAIAIIEHYLKVNSFAHPESKDNQDDLKFQTTKEHMEQWIVQALGAEPLGSGSYPVDVKTKDFLADIKSMSIKTNNGIITGAESGETSLGQYFQITELDSYFAKHEYEKIKDLWIDILYKKYHTVVEDTKIDKIYYICFMRADLDYYVFVMSLNYKVINKNIIVNVVRTTKDSIFLDNFIDPKFGSTKIYKAKKRLELRLKPKSFVENGLYFKFNTLQYPNKTDLRKVDIQQYLKDKIKKFFTFFI
jgi:hypothetical protein